MAALLGIVAVLAGIGSLVCWIMILVKMFKNGETVLGIVSIFCAIVGYIMGWVKSSEWNTKQIMLIWTACIVVGIIANVVAGGMAAANLPQ